MCVSDADMYMCVDVCSYLSASAQVWMFAYVNGGVDVYGYLIVRL